MKEDLFESWFGTWRKRSKVLFILRLGKMNLFVTSPLKVFSCLHNFAEGWVCKKTDADFSPSGGVFWGRTWGQEVTGGSIWTSLKWTRGSSCNADGSDLQHQSASGLCHRKIMTLFSGCSEIYLRGCLVEEPPVLGSGGAASWKKAQRSSSLEGSFWATTSR